MGCLRGMSSLIFNKDGQVSSSSFLKNGSMLLEELIASCNGRYNIPIRNFSAKEILKATNNFDQHQVILEDGSCNIYKGSLEERPILVKKFYYSKFVARFFGHSTLRAAIRDIVITSQMRSHKNVARFFGCCLEFECPALVYEYSGDVPLKNLLYNTDGGASSSGHDQDRSLSWKSRLRIAKEIANAVSYLHTALSRPVVNRDLKPSNIMVDQRGVAKLFDFSLSISIPLGESRVEDDLRGTVGFIDPEYSGSSFVTEKSDVYGFGVLLLTLLTGQPPHTLLIGLMPFICEEVDHYLLTQSTVLKDFVKKTVEKDQFTKILDPMILGGIEQEHQLRASLALASRCIELKGEDRPEMIDVAKELRQIERSVIHP